MTRPAMVPPARQPSPIIRYVKDIKAGTKSHTLFDRLSSAGVVINCRDRARTLFQGNGFAALEGLINRAKGLVLEIDNGFSLGPAALARILRFGIMQLEIIGEDLRVIRVQQQKTNGRKVSFSPKRWSSVAAEEQQGLDIIGLKAALTGLLEVEKALSKSASVDAAEEAIAEILTQFFMVKAVKIYDVSETGSVRVSHSFVPHGRDVIRQERDVVVSHFSSFVPPHDFRNEAMFEVLSSQDAIPYVLVSSPKTDPRCRKVGFDGDEEIELIIESAPFALIGERGQRGVRRVYKIDWATPEDLEIFSEQAIDTIFQRLSAFKANFAMESERKFLDKIEEISHSGESLQAILALVSVEIAAFISGGGKLSAEKVTIMLYDRITKCLETRIIWNNDEIVDVSYFSGPGNRGVGRRFFDSAEEAPLYLARLSDWSGRSVKWSNGGEGSLIVAKIGKQDDRLGVIVVSSSQKEAFTIGQLEVLERVSHKITPAFERISRHLEELSFETKFGGRGSEKLRLFNPDCLKRKLHVDLKLAQSEGKEFCLLFLDIDNFGLLNKIWLDEHVDKVLRKILSRIINALRTNEEAEVYRYGGEEIVVRVSANLSDSAKLAERLRAIVSKEIRAVVSYPSQMKATGAVLRIEGKKKSLDAAGLSGIIATDVQPGRGVEGSLIVTVAKTISIGVTRCQADDTVESLLLRAQGAEKAAKEGVADSDNHGRNQTVVALPEGKFDYLWKPAI